MFHMCSMMTWGYVNGDRGRWGSAVQWMIEVKPFATVPTDLA
jgi:hypothetical protein